MLLEAICNVTLPDQRWVQASLPVNSGGLWIRSLTQLAPSAFLASAAGCFSVSSQILPERCACMEYSLVNDALSAWKHLVPSSVDCPFQSDALKQKVWDGPVVKSV